MESDIALLIIIIARVIVIATIYFTFLKLKAIASLNSLLTYLAAAGGYLYYVSINTVTTIPHTHHDVIRLLTITTIFIIMYKHIKEK